MASLAEIEDDALVASLVRLVGSHRKVMSEILRHLAEVEERRIHLRRGFDSMFAYCVMALGFSEDEAYRRVEAARISAKFPDILTMVADGKITLSVLVLLKPRMSEGNSKELLAGVQGLTVRKAKEWLAAKFPTADIPDSVRKLPEPRAPSETLSSERDGIDEVGTVIQETTGSASNPETKVNPTSQSAAIISDQRRRAVVEPLSADRFSIKMSVSRRVRDKLELARDLSRHRNATGGLEAVLEMALDALIEDISRKKLGKSQRPRSAKSGSSKNTRYVSRHRRREAVNRSGLQCEHVAPDGTRCAARAFLEFDHVEPVALGGGPESCIRLLCRSHNRLAAEDVFGKERVAAALAHARRQRKEHRDATAPPENARETG